MQKINPLNNTVEVAQENMGFKDKENIDWGGERNAKSVKKTRPISSKVLKVKNEPSN